MLFANIGFIDLLSLLLKQCDGDEFRSRTWFVFAEQSVSWEPREWIWCGWSSWIEERNVSEQNLKQAPLL